MLVRCYGMSYVSLKAGNTSPRYPSIQGAWKWRAKHSSWAAGRGFSPMASRLSFMSHLVVGSNQINWKLKWTTCAPVISLLWCFGGFDPHKCSSLAISLTKILVKWDCFPCHNWYLKFGSTTKEWSLNIVELWNDKSRLHPILFGNKLMFGPWHAQLKFQFRQLGCCISISIELCMIISETIKIEKIKHITYRRWMA